MPTGVSYVVPVYNKADCIRPVLHQIAKQVGEFTKQYIFVDDGSTDDSLEIVRDVTQGWENATIVSQQNRGSANATNRGIALVTQPFIKFVDADDQLTEDATITLLQALIGTDACLSYGKAIRGSQELPLNTRKVPPPIHIEKNSLRLTIKHSHFTPSQCLVKTEAVRAVGGCDERIIHSQEYSLSLRLAYHWPFVRVEAPIVRVPEQVAQRLSDDQGQQHKRGALALSLFFGDYPDISEDLKRFGAKRVAGRAWKYARRYKGETFLSKWFGLYLLSRMGGVRDVTAFIEMCCEAFD